MKKLFCIMGRTCAGKTSLAKAVAESFNMKVVKSYTTRPMREGENEHTSDHIFVSDDEMKLFQGKIAAYTEINDYKYFVTKDMIMNSDIYVIDPDGYKMLTEYVKRKELKIELIPIYIDVDVADQEGRYRARGNTREQFWERYKSEAEQFSKFEEEMNDWWEGEYVYVIKNIDFQYSVKKMKEYIYERLNLIEKIKYKLRRLLK
ncbi:hypothetical protein [Blautia sp.]|uniref:hypothetical protein n=1 Tax=Blautia sp. TaxID=1955243 RepID=UPI002E7759B4|nr:hypothetical protein [Blautia sp.]MEE0811377.1 hypothetical protein [Blautia sp.]